MDKSTRNLLIILAVIVAGFVVLDWRSQSRFIQISQTRPTDAPATPMFTPNSIPTTGFTSSSAQVSTRSVTPTVTVQTGCPHGCVIPSAGCRIKGSVDVFEREEAKGPWGQVFKEYPNLFGSSSPTETVKTYYTPEQALYDWATVAPDLGGRWFCTEVEAIANGWTKSSGYPDPRDRENRYDNR